MSFLKLKYRNRKVNLDINQVTVEKFVSQKWKLLTTLEAHKILKAQKSLENILESTQDLNPSYNKLNEPEL